MTTGEQVKKKVLEKLRKFYSARRKGFSVFLKEAGIFWKFFIQRKYVYLWIPAIIIFLFAVFVVPKIHINLPKYDWSNPQAGVLNNASGTVEQINKGIFL